MDYNLFTFFKKKCMKNAHFKTVNNISYKSMTFATSS